MKQAIQGPGIPQPPFHVSPAIRCDDYLFTSGFLATDWINPRPPSTRLPHLGAATRAEVRQVFANLEAVVNAANFSMFEIARVDNFYGHRDVSTGHFAARDEYYPIDPMEKPASTAVQTSGFLAEECTYAVEAIGIKGPQSKLVTDQVAASPGRLPMGIRAGDFVFLSGRMASDYKDGLAAEARTRPWIWIGSPIREQAAYILGMHQDILREGGLSLHDIVKSEVFLTNPDDITVLDEVWAEFFPTDPPARSLFIVDGLGIDEAVVEINHIALQPDSDLRRRTIIADKAQRPIFYEPHAVKAGPLLFLSTQVAHDESGLHSAARIPPGFPHLAEPGRLETEVVLDNVDAICRAAGGDLSDVVKVQIHLRDLRHFDAVNEVWKRRFPGIPPAWTIAEMRSPRPIAGAQLMFDVIAYLGDGLDRG